MKVAFLGLGNMGTPMARKLIHAGHDVTVWNRTLAKAEPLRAEGAKIGQSVGEATKQAEIAITMLADDVAVESAVLHPGGIVEHLPLGATHISMSTISVSLSNRAGGRAPQAWTSFCRRSGVRTAGGCRGGQVVRGGGRRKTCSGALPAGAGCDRTEGIRHR